MKARTVFLGWANYTGQEAISTLFIPKFLLKLTILYLKFHKCQIPGPGKCHVLPIGADAHGWKLMVPFVWVQIWGLVKLTPDWSRHYCWQINRQTISVFVERFLRNLNQFDEILRWPLKPQHGRYARAVWIQNSILMLFNESIVYRVCFCSRHPYLINEY